PGLGQRRIQGSTLSCVRVLSGQCKRGSTQQARGAGGKNDLFHRMTPEAVFKKCWPGSAHQRCSGSWQTPELVPVHAEKVQQPAGVCLCGRMALSALARTPLQALLSLE